jgi:hypothetical protein
MVLYKPGVNVCPPISAGRSVPPVLEVTSAIAIVRSEIAKAVASADASIPDVIYPVLNPVIAPVQPTFPPLTVVAAVPARDVVDKTAKSPAVPRSTGVVNGIVYKIKTHFYIPSGRVYQTMDLKIN